MDQEGIENQVISSAELLKIFEKNRIYKTYNTEKREYKES